MEELDQFTPIRSGSAKDLDELADLLVVMAINLKEAGRHEELGHGSLYIKIQKKITESMLAATTDGCLNIRSQRVWRLRGSGLCRKVNFIVNFKVNFK